MTQMEHGFTKLILMQMRILLTGSNLSDRHHGTSSASNVFFRWRCWWDYSTGLSGDLFTHEYDALNQILGLGIPHSATASGGIYYYKDGRTVPDVLNMAFEYPNRELTLLYSATLASEKERRKVIMGGHDAYMELDKTLLVVADPKSTRYKEKIEKGIIEPHKPIFSYVPGQEKWTPSLRLLKIFRRSRASLYLSRREIFRHFSSTPTRMAQLYKTKQWFTTKL